MKKLIMVLLSLFLLLGCNVTGDNNNTDSNNDNSNTVVGSRGKVHDSNGIFIGYATAVTKEVVFVYTTKGYLVMLTWDGAIDNDGTYYTSTDCTGTPYSLTESIPTAKIIVFNNHSGLLTYIPDTNGLAKQTSVTTFNSYYTSYDNAFHNNSTYTLSSEEYAFELQSISRADVGLPETIGALSFTPE